MEYQDLGDYQVQLNDSSIFKFNGFRLNNELFADIRSISGKIGDIEFNKEIFKDILDHFLRYSNNIELINILSRKLNKYNYFEVYNGKVPKLEIDDIIGKDEPRSHDLGIYLASIKQNSKNNRHLIPTAVISHIHNGIELYKPLDFENIDFYPIWYINGNKFSSSCELYCHFSILIHILSKVFVEFKSQILQLSSSEIQIAQLYGETVEERLTKSNTFLKNELVKLKDENAKQRDQINELNRNLVQAHRDNEHLRESNDRLNLNLDRAQTALDIAINRIETLNETNTNLTTRVEELNTTNTNLNRHIEELNGRLRTFTPSNSSTNSIHFYLRLYISDQHPKNPLIRAKATTGKIWIGIYCGELANYSKTIRDPRARVLVTYPINSRDSLTYINDIIGDDYIQGSNYKHWLVNARDLGSIIDNMAQVLIDNEAIVGQIDFNRDVLNEIVNVEPEDIIQEVEPDPVENEPQNNNTPVYDFAEISRFEYYYRRCYRRINESPDEYRLYFLIGNARNRVREYILYEDLERLTRRRID